MAVVVAVVGALGCAAAARAAVVMGTVQLAEVAATVGAAVIVVGTVGAVVLMKVWMKAVKSG